MEPEEEIDEEGVPKSLPDQLTTRRFKSSGDASKELFDRFNDWASALTARSIQASFAIIAANWAVYGSEQAILANPLSKWSLTIAMVFLGLNVTATWWMAVLYGRRVNHAQEDKDRWETEYIQVANRQAPWPYTKLIEGLGGWMRVANALVPLVAGSLFIASLF